MTFELKNVKNSDFNCLEGEVHVNGKFICIEYGNTEEELRNTFATSKDIYEMLATEAEVE